MSASINSVSTAIFFYHEPGCFRDQFLDYVTRPNAILLPFPQTS